jgi:hypothetical protein
MTDEGIADVVQDRLARFWSSGDRRVIVEPEAADEVVALRASIGWPAFAPPPAGASQRRELDTVVLAGTLQFVRSQELEPVDRLDAYLEAMELFTCVYPLVPGLVPEPVRAMCDALAGNPPGVHHAELHNEAIDTLDTAGADRSVAVGFVCPHRPIASQRECVPIRFRRRRVPCRYPVPADKHLGGRTGSCPASPSAISPPGSRPVPAGLALS